MFLQRGWFELLLYFRICLSPGVPARVAIPCDHMTRDALLRRSVVSLVISQLSSWISVLVIGLTTFTNTMPRKKASNDTQSSALHQPTIAGFINSISTSMANPGAKPQPTAGTATTPKPPKSATSTTPIASATKSPAKSGRRSGTKRTRKTPAKKKALARQKSPSDDSGDDSDAGALRAIRFESQQEGSHTGESTIELTSSNEDEEGQITSAPRLKRTATQKMRASSGSPSDSDIEMIGGSAGAPRKVKRRLKRRLTSSDEEGHTETEEEEKPSPKKRRLVKGLKPSTSEEETNLMDEIDKHRE